MPTFIFYKYFSVSLFLSYNIAVNIFKYVFFWGGDRNIFKLFFAKMCFFMLDFLGIFVKYSIFNSNLGWKFFSIAKKYKIFTPIWRGNIFSKRRAPIRVVIFFSKRCANWRGNNFQ